MTPHNDGNGHKPDRDGADPSNDGLVVHVVDDDPSALALLCDIAEDSGWVARGFTRLRDLGGALAGERPGLLILDDDLPDGRGGDLARDLREDPRTSDVPLIVCTAAPPTRQAEIGAWAPVVAKPFRIDELQHVFDAAARRVRRRNFHGAAGAG